MSCSSRELIPSGERSLLDAQKNGCLTVGFQWHNYMIARSSLTRCTWMNMSLDQTVFGTQTLLNRCLFHRVYFSRINNFYGMKSSNTTFSNCSGTHFWEDSVSDNNRFVNCQMDHFISQNTSWNACQWMGKNSIAELQIDSKSTFDHKCDMSGVSIHTLYNTPFRQQIRLLKLGAKVEHGLHPVLAVAQKLKVFE